MSEKIQLTDANVKMTHMFKLSDEDFKAASVRMLHEQLQTHLK